MTKHLWKLDTSISAIIFDCDGTLSAVEGIDELAERNQVGPLVKKLTADAMGKTGLNPEVFRERLSLVRPTKLQVEALGAHYYTQRIPHVADVIALLTRLNKAVYVVSAGLNPAVKIFAEQLQIAQENIFAVDAYFDEKGDYIGFDESSPLVHNNGKWKIVEKIKKNHEHIIYVGDGMNDLAVLDLVTKFIGFGGSFYRENIAKVSDYYIERNSMAELLPLVLLDKEQTLLTPSEKNLYQVGLNFIKK